jgi:hypothetical protein
MRGEESDDTSSDDLDILPIAREEAHRTIDNQIQTLNDIDSKAARILRINLLLLGILLTGLSIAAPSQGTETAPISYNELANIYNYSGIVFLLLSTGVAAVTYTASSLQAGIGPRDLREILDNDYTDRQNLAGLVDSYADWIEYNYQVNSKNAPLGTLTLLLLIFGMTSVTLGVKKAITGTVEWWLLVGVVLLLITMIYLTGIVEQVSRWNRVRE